MEPNNSAPAIVAELIHRAEQVRASDVHLQMHSNGADVSFRLDGLMTPVQTYPKELAERVFGRIKFLARLKTYQESLPQDGRINKDEASSKADIRVATYPTVTGEKIVLRLFREEKIQTFTELGFSDEARTAIESVLGQTSGLILLTGPAGSGKTTTIYTCLRFLSKHGGRHIITIEDPVEQVIPGIMQTEVNEPRGLNFPTAARHLLRQDPQVLVIGEIRDEETAQIAVRAASTGHLVISTVHAGSCPGVIDRLLLLCPDLYSVLSSLELIVNQRLVRCLCADCKGVGCDSCLKSGYKGRIPLVEFVRLNDSGRRDLKAGGVLLPKLTLEESAQRLLASENTNRAELERIFGRDVNIPK